MNKQTTVATITLTFVSYMDFVAELVRREVSEARLTSGTRAKPVSDGPGPFLDYIVILTALDGKRHGTPEVLTCTLRVGGCWDLFQEQHPECSANLRAASEIVRDNLKRWGFCVRPGVYAHDSNWGYATPSGLWHFQNENGLAVLTPGVCRDDTQDEREEAA
jgi:hypothetical protein